MAFLDDDLCPVRSKKATCTGSQVVHHILERAGFAVELHVTVPV